MLLACLCSSACTEKKPPIAPAPGPEQVFAECQEALNRKDWEACFNCVDPSEQDVLLVVASIDATLAGMNREKGQPGCLEILERHGVRGELPTESVNMADREKMKELLVKPFAEVKDKSALFKDLMDHVDAAGKLSECSVLSFIPSGVLSNLEVRTKGAKGDLTRPGQSKPQKIHFVLRDGKWKFYFGKFKGWPD